MWGCFNVADSQKNWIMTKVLRGYLYMRIKVERYSAKSQMILDLYSQHLRRCLRALQK